MRTALALPSSGDMKTLWFALFSLSLAPHTICDTEHSPRSIASRSVNSSAALFHHRGFHACKTILHSCLTLLVLTAVEAVVIGDYLFIDGGEVTTWDGTGSGVQTAQPQVNGNIDTQPGRASRKSK